MAPERSLIPPEDNSSSSFQTAANVVGVIPPQIHDILTNSDALTTSKIDDNTSGLSYLINNTNSNIISVWEHSTQTLNEELIPPTRGICVNLIHPEHDTTTVDNNNKLLVTCLGPNNNTSTNNHRRGEGNNNTLRHLYAASSTSGVLSVWVLDNNTTKNTTSTTNDGFVECDASVRLALKDNEVLTSLTSMNNNNGGNSGNNSDTWLLASTNYGRLYKIYKTSRPLTLSAKLIKKKMIPNSNVSGQQVDVEEEETGLVRGLYNYFTTPSKKKVESSYGDDEVMDEGLPGSPYNSSLDDENIVALVTLPSTTSSDGSGIDSAESYNKSPPRTPAHSPQKQRRISSTSTPNSSLSARAVSVSSSLVVKEWKVSLLAGPDSSNSEGGGKNKEGYMTRTQLFPRHENGTLDLSSLSQENLEGYTHIEMLASPQLVKDNKSLLIIIRLSKENDVDATRAYVVRIGLSSNGRSSPQIIDSAWLDRYSGQSLDVLDCVGLVTAEEDDGDNNVGGAVVYVAFGQGGGNTSGERQVCPVTISAVHFSSSEDSATRIKDIDLYQNVVPSAIHNSMSYDPLTGGCVLLSTSGLLCGVHVRFPTLSSGQEGMTTTTESLLDEASLSIVAKDETVQTVKSHLQSSFRQYLTKLKEGNSGSNPARAVVPPSIGTCPSHVLTAAVVLASKEFACASSSSSSAGTGVFSPRVTTSTPVTILRDKLQLHKDFITFLLHAGAYRRVSSVVGRIRLRDHGELITASRALLIACQNYFAKAESAAAGNSTRQDKIAKERRVVMKALEKTSEDVTALPRRWAALQQLSSLTFVNSGDFLLFTSSSICHGVGQSLGYRQHESSSMYDIAISDPSSQTALPYPWTSSTETLDVLITQLQAIEESGEAILSNSVDYETEKNNMRRYVEDMSASALSGYRDIVTRDADNKAALGAYDQAKRLTIPLLRKYANDDGDDLVALATSLDHSFFEGIVQICHDHRQSWRFQGPYSDKEADERYDLRLMMSNLSTTDSESYAHLHSSRDYQSDLSFCTFVLKWYADRGLYPEVFELGKSCPHDLTRYVRNDDLSNLSWVQQLRVGGHEQATVGLMSVNTPVLFGDKEEGPLSLWEKDQMMSLAKLSNKLAIAKNPHAEVDTRSLQIENSLTLISAQTILQEDTAHGDEVVLKEDDLLRLAVEKIQSSRDVDEIKRFGICGLAIASAKLPSQTEAMANDASYIWQAVIKSDIHTWESTTNENSMAVGGISEEELIRRVEGTAFVEVMYDFVSTSEGKMQSVSYTDASVRNNVSHALGSDALSKVLALSADIVVAANLE